MLTVLGISEYENSILMFLLGNSNSTAKSIVKSTKIPTSKVYTVLNELINKDLIRADNDRPKHYFSLSSQELIDKIITDKAGEIDHFKLLALEIKHALIQKFDTNESLSDRFSINFLNNMSEFFEKIINEDIKTIHCVIELNQFHEFQKENAIEYGIKKISHFITSKPSFEKARFIIAVEGIYDEILRNSIQLEEFSQPQFKITDKMDFTFAIVNNEKLIYCLPNKITPELNTLTFSTENTSLIEYFKSKSFKMWEKAISLDNNIFTRERKKIINQLEKFVKLGNYSRALNYIKSIENTLENKRFKEKLTWSRQELNKFYFEILLIKCDIYQTLGKNEQLIELTSNLIERTKFEREKLKPDSQHYDQATILYGKSIIRKIAILMIRGEEFYLEINLFETIMNETKIYNNKEFNRLKATLQNMLGINAMQNGRLQEAENYFNSSLKLFRDLNLEVRVPIAYLQINLAVVNSERHDFQKSIKYYKDCIEILLEDNRQNAILPLFGIIFVLSFLEKRKEIQRYLEIMYELSIDFKNENNDNYYNLSQGIVWDTSNRMELKVKARNVFKDQLVKMTDSRLILTSISKLADNLIYEYELNQNPDIIAEFYSLIKEVKPFYLQDNSIYNRINFELLSFKYILLKNDKTEARLKLREIRSICQSNKSDLYLHQINSYIKKLEIIEEEENNSILKILN